MEYETCYILGADQAHQSPDSSTKKRKADQLEGLHASWPRRRKLYNELWTQHRQAFSAYLADLDTSTVNDVKQFICSAPSTNDSKIDAVILVTGADLTVQAQLSTHVYKAVQEDLRACLVSVRSHEAINLKAILKRVNTIGSLRVATDDDDSDETIDNGKTGGKLLNYDLRVLEQAVKDQSLEKVIVAFEDCEAFEGSVLSETVELFSYWKDRIPFVFIFQLATSVESLQAKLSRRATRCIRGRRFDVADSHLALEDMVSLVYGRHNKLWLGPTVCRAIMSRQHDYLQGLQAVEDSLQYIHMTHFYANAASLFLDDSISLDDIPADHFEALRNLPSFMAYAQGLLDSEQGMGPTVRTLLESDVELLKTCRTLVAEGQQQMADMIDTAYIHTRIVNSIQGLEKVTGSEVLIQALANTLLNSAKQKALFLAMKRVRSDALHTVLDEAGETRSTEFKTTITTLKHELTTLTDAQNEGDAPLRSEVDIQNSTLRTTVVAKKVGLSKAKTTLSEADVAYSKILARFIEALEGHFASTLIDPKSLPFNEIFFFDLKSPYRNVFMPRPRFAIERALSTPRDYLDYEVTDAEDAESSLSPSSPATALLYQLYLESGSMINAADLRSAFMAILEGTANGEDELAAVFQRSLAELSYLGMVKSTKKKTDHVLKMAWRGL